MPCAIPLSHREPDFSQVRSALLCGQPNYVPAVELFHDIEVKEAFLGRPIRTFADDVEFHYLAGYDYYSAWVTFREIRMAVERNLTKPLTFTNSPYQAARPRRWSPEDGAMITSFADFESFPWPKPEPATLELVANGMPAVPLPDALREIKSALRPGMGLILCTDGIFERFTKDLMGYETFCYMLYDQPELIYRMFARVGELWLAIYQHAARMAEVDALWLADDIAYGQGLMFSPQVMRRHLFPWYQCIGDAAAQYNKPLLFHSDGDLRPILPDLIRCGIKGIQPIEPKAMDINVLKREFAGRLSLIGNIDLGSTLVLGTPAEVKAEVRERIRCVAPGGGYCVGSSNSVTNYVPLANFVAMLEATFEHGRYPIA
jgi:uroporphyrinogen decarboxylase